MAEYIDTEPLKKEIADWKRTIHSENTDYQTGYMSALSVVEGMIAEQPAADVEPVRRGHWVINSDGYYPQCSECMKEPQGRVMTDWCPNCGAKMKGGENNA